jgi:hypothetical protein
VEKAMRLLSSDQARPSSVPLVNVILRAFAAPSTGAQQPEKSSHLHGQIISD